MDQLLARQGYFMAMKRVDAAGIQRLLDRERRDLAHLQHEEVRPLAFGRISARWS